MSDRTAADRMKRYRSRLKSGTIFAQVELPYSLTESLIESGHITEQETLSPRRCGEALVEFIKGRKKVVTA